MRTIELPKYLQLSQDIEARIRNGRCTGGKIPSVRDIAETHGVSVVTASRALQVLRDKGLISSIERSGSYLVPDQSREHETWAIHLHLTPGPWIKAVASVALAGFEALARREALKLRSDCFSLQPGMANRDVQRQVRAARDESVSGLFLLPARVNEEQARLDEVLLDACRAADLPVVLLERNLRGEDRPLEWDLVGTDDVEGGRALTRHLIAHGRKRIACVVGSPTSSHIGRVAGYLYALNAAGRRGHEFAPPVVLYQRADVSEKEANRELADALIKHRSDSVICHSDYTAIGLVLELLSRGVRVPADVAVCGFDNMPIGNMFAVGITTYAFPSEEIARQALRLMRDRARQRFKTPVRVVVPGELIARESTQNGTGK